MDSVIIFGAKYLFVAALVIYVLAIAQASPKHRKALVLTLISAGILAVIMDKLAGKLYYDPRPFVTHNVKPLVSHSADNGFPSEHTILTATLSAALIYYRRRLGAASFLIALLVGLSRIAAHVHSPIDIVGGALIGIAAGSGGYYLVRSILISKRSGGQPADSR